PGPTLQRLHEDILRQAPQLDLRAPSHTPTPSLMRTNLGSPEGATQGRPASPSTLESIPTKTVRDLAILSEGQEPRRGSGGQTLRPRLLRRGWVRAAIVALVALTVGALTAIPDGGG